MGILPRPPNCLPRPTEALPRSHELVPRPHGCSPPRHELVPRPHGSPAPTKRIVCRDPTEVLPRPLEVFTPPPAPPEGAKSMEFIESASFLDKKVCHFMISVTFENPCTFENVTGLENMELQGNTKVSAPPPTPPEGAKSMEFIESASFS